MTELGKPESTCRRVCQPFYRISEEISPLQCSDESLTLALSPRSHHLTQDVADTLTAPRMVLTPGGGAWCIGEQALVEATKKKMLFLITALLRPVFKVSIARNLLKTLGKSLCFPGPQLFSAVK